MPGTPTDLADLGGPHTFYPDPGSVWIADKILRDNAMRVTPNGLSSR